MRYLLAFLMLLWSINAWAQATPAYQQGTPVSGHPAMWLDSGQGVTLQDGGSNTVTFGTVLTSINTQSGTTYTLAASDCGKTILFTNAAAVTVTTLNSIGAGCYINIEQGGAGQVTIAAGSGATQHSAHSYTKTSAQYALIGLFVDTNAGGSAADFIIYGDGA